MSTTDMALEAVQRAYQILDRADWVVPMPDLFREEEKLIVEAKRALRKILIGREMSVLLGTREDGWTA